jgi:hypothetical protein
MQKESIATALCRFLGRRWHQHGAVKFFCLMGFPSMAAPVGGEPYGALVLLAFVLDQC